MEHISFLRKHIAEIVSLTVAEFDSISGFFIPCDVKKKEYLIRVGQKVSAEFLVIRGCLKTIAYGDEGKEYIMQFAQENWWVSDYPAYARQSLSEMDVQAVEDSFLLSLSVPKKKEMCVLVPQMHMFFEKKAFNGYVAAQKRVLSLMRNSAKEKYELLLDQYPELFQRLPKKVIAQYLGVSRETLSRLQNN